jgi:hypothetical protein
LTRRDQPDLGLNNAAASNAVISASNSKDVISLALTGRTGKSDNHAQAFEELKRSGPVRAELTSTLSRVLNLETLSQYASRSMSAAEAGKAVELPAGCTWPPKVSFGIVENGLTWADEGRRELELSPAAGGSAQL